VPRISVPSLAIIGGKTLTGPAILADAPIKEGHRCIDICAGRANLTFQAWGLGFRFKQWILNDPIQAPFLHAIRDVGHLVKVPERSEEEYEKTKRLAAAGDQRALCLSCWFCFNGGGFGNGKSFPGTGPNGGRRTGGGRRTPESMERNLVLAHDQFVEHDVQIFGWDWLTCLEKLQPTKDDLIMFDGPYLGCHVGVYEDETFIPNEAIDYIQHHPEINFLFCEYDAAIYTHAFGPPASQKTVTLRATNFRQIGEVKTRTECVWTYISCKAHLARTGEKAPETLHATLRKEKDLGSLSIPELLAEIKEVNKRIAQNQLRTTKEIRKHLLLLLIELKKRFYRKPFGYYAALRSIGLDPNTVRSWFFRGRHADEVIEMLEQPEEITSAASTTEPHERPLSAEEECLQQADKMAAAVLKENIARAKRLAAEYANARREMLGT